jgi:dTDP-4-dehydrorhamnose 3,5-epimerase
MDGAMYGSLVSTETIFKMITVEDLPLKDAKVIKLKRHGDNRGWFTEDFRESWLEEIGITNKFIFDYSSFSTDLNTLRGMHAQTAVCPQAKLVSIFNGSILDVLVDARLDSPTYGQSCKINITKDNPIIVYVPRGFYHGFLTLEPNTYVNYKLDNYYNAQAECGIAAEDVTLDIQWPFVPDRSLIVSDRDLSHPTWNNAYKFQGKL